MGTYAYIRVNGVPETIAALKNIDRDIAKDFKKGLREDVRPLVTKAKSFAQGLGGSGDYAASFGVRTNSKGVYIYSSDPGAGVIEFANPGALVRSGKRMGKPAGVPSGSPPRALVKARDEEEPLIVEAVHKRIQDIIRSYLNG